MGILDSLLGNAQPERRAPRPGAQNGAAMTDQRAIERYRYMLKTAPPETLEQAHTEAFARLTPDQRRLALQTLATAAPPEEKASTEATSPDDASAMGRLATRAEMRQPGFVERNFGGGGGGMGMGGSLLSSFAMGFAGSMIAQSFFSSFGGHEALAGDHDAGHDGQADAGDATEAGDVADGGDADVGLDGGDMDMDLGF